MKEIFRKKGGWGGGGVIFIFEKTVIQYRSLSGHSILKNLKYIHKNFFLGKSRMLMYMGGTEKVSSIEL